MKRHKCLTQIDASLAEYNTRLSTNLFDNNWVLIETEKIKNFRDGKKAKTVVAAYCPFCGKKLPVK